MENVIIKVEQTVPQVLVKVTEGGIKGDSAYKIAVDEGFVGTEAEWLTSLVYNDTTIQTEVSLNTLKVGITPQQASDIVTNNNKVSDINHVTLELPNIDNTSDANKPISSATQTALNGKVDDSQVLTNVPIDAVFTDTPYNDTAIQAEVDLNTLKETNIAHPLVEKAVPSDALFTDTVYNDTAIQASVLANTTAIGDIDTAIDIINGQII